MTRLHSFLATWLALAIVCTGATGLRPPGLPVGPGEVLLAGWLMFVGLLLLRGLKINLGPTFQLFLLYWLAAGALLGLGAVVSKMTGRMDAASSIHDTIAFMLQAVLVCFAVMFASEREFYLAVARRTLWFFTFFATTILIVGYIAPRGLGFEIWYGGVRYSGWAKNPNQMALFALGMPFLGWYLLQRTRGFGRKLPYIVAIFACIIVGYETKSDGLRVAWLGGVTVLAFWAWYRALLAQRGRFLYISFIIVPIAAVSLTVAFGKEFVDRLEHAVQEMYDEGDQGEGRVVRWTNGIRAMMQSPLVGFGPGSYSGEIGPFEGKEAHNFIIDWGASTGILGVVLHLSLYAWGVMRTLRARQLTLFAMLAAFAGFGMFAYTLRQPIYWLILILALLLSAERAPKRSRAASVPGPEAPGTARARLSPQH